MNGFPMLEDQKHILSQILQHIDEIKPQAIVIAGDVYDKSVPAAEAVELLDEFLCELANRELHVFVVSGNHDSVERLAFASRLIESSGVHIARVYDGQVKPIVLQDENGPVNFYMMPFVKPFVVKECFPEESINTYTDALAVAVKQMDINEKERNLLVAHQFVTGTKGVAGVLRSDSEDISVGGLNNVDASVLAPFDYVALGHIHNEQPVGRETVRYAGCPLYYDFSELGRCKDLTLVTVNGKNDISIEKVPIPLLHTLKQVSGSLEEILEQGQTIPEESILYSGGPARQTCSAARDGTASGRVRQVSGQCKAGISAYRGRDGSGDETCRSSRTQHRCTVRRLLSGDTGRAAGCGSGGADPEDPGTAASQGRRICCECQGGTVR